MVADRGAGGGTDVPERIVGKRWKRWALPISVWVVTPLVLLMLLEVALRVGGCGHSTRPFVEKRGNGHRYYSYNLFYMQQFIDPGPRTFRDGAGWDYLAFEVPEPKDDNTYRIFVLGSSAANGWPGQMFALARFLEVMLQARFPTVRFEVYDAAFTAMNSHVMRGSARACARLHPDLFVVYMGNNEVSGPFAMFPSVGLVRACIWLKEFRLFQISGRLLGKLPLTWPGGDMRPDGKGVARAYSNYRANVEDICDAAREAGASVMLCTVGCNVRDWPPSNSSHWRNLSDAERTAFDQPYQEGMAKEKSGLDAEALEAYGKALSVDNEFAPLLFKMGKCYLRLGDTGQARNAFAQAMEWDNFGWPRAREPVNEILREIASGRSNKGVYLVDTARLLAEKSPGGIPGTEFFIDNCHFKPEGAYVVSRAIAEQVMKAMPESLRSKADPERPLLTLAECEVRLALTPAAIINPMRGVLDSEKSVGALPPYLAQLDEYITELSRQPVTPGDIFEGYRRALEAGSTDYVIRSRYALELVQRGDAETALTHARMLTAQEPCRRLGRRILGMSLSATGRDAEAIAEFAPLLKADPDDFDTLRELSRVYMKTGECRKALPLCQRARALDPRDSSAAFDEARVLEKVDETAALKAYRELIAVNPQYLAAYDALDVVLTRRDDPGSRVAAWRDIVAGHPGVAMAYLCLGRALASQQDADGAIEAYREGIKIDDKNGQLKVALGQQLVRNGAFQEAISPLRTALTLGPIPPDAQIDLVMALYEIKDYAAAREEGELCLKSGFMLPPDLVEKLDQAR